MCVCVCVCVCACVCVRVCVFVCVCVFGELLFYSVLERGSDENCVCDCKKEKFGGEHILEGKCIWSKSVKYVSDAVTLPSKQTAQRRKNRNDHT